MMKKPTRCNLFSDLYQRHVDNPNEEADSENEIVDVLCRGESIRIERIVSTGQCSPAGFWYDQQESEWVVVLRGRARLQFEQEAEPMEMGPGDCTLIPPRCRHRVASTSGREPTVWLAVFFDETITGGTLRRQADA